MSWLFYATVAVVFVSLTLTPLILFLRTRAKSAVFMGAGMMVFWIGVALLFFGPRTITYVESRSETGLVTASSGGTQPPIITNYLLGIGALSYCGGLLFFSLRGPMRNGHPSN
ncbi:MAG: hypothetical protein AAF438_06350 [Pseudomonadota bacterium]